jgi:hypothetical protein
MEALITLAIIGIIFAIGKFSIQQKLISKSIVDYSKPVGAMATFVAGILVTGTILMSLLMILFFLYTIL